MKFALFAIVLIVGLAGGGAAGMFLAPKPAVVDDAASPNTDKAKAEGSGSDDQSGDEAYVEFADQFILPLIEDGRVREHVVLSIALETTSDAKEALKGELAKIRAEIVVALYDFAAIDGFSPQYQSSESLSRLTRMVQEAVDRSAKTPKTRALITNFVRQKA